MVNMNISHRKQPELVRSNLLGQALSIIQEAGLQALTLDAVAKQAGVSKGGLLHHFPSKQALIDAMVAHVFNLIETRIEAALENDTVAKGRFTRAYLSLLRDPNEQVNAAQSKESQDELEYLYSIPLTTLMFDDDACRMRWRNWLAEQLKRHEATDDFDNARLVRFAADGIWLSGLLDYDSLSKQEYQALIEQLKAMTY